MVVGKTGAAEKPLTQCHLSDRYNGYFKTKSEWKSGRSYDELADAINEKLETIPGIF